jgi:hypothetical protein
MLQIGDVRTLGLEEGQWLADITDRSALLGKLVGGFFLACLKDFCCGLFASVLG